MVPFFLKRDLVSPDPVCLRRPVKPALQMIFPGQFQEYTDGNKDQDEHDAQYHCGDDRTDRMRGRHPAAISGFQGVDVKRRNADENRAATQQHKRNKPHPVLHNPRGAEPGCNDPQAVTENQKIFFLFHHINLEFAKSVLCDTGPCAAAFPSQGRIDSGRDNSCPYT